MRLETVHIRNFRLLRRFSIDLTSAKPTTVLVGPNNSGKTSVMDALRIFAGTNSDASKVSLHDISQIRHNDLKRLEQVLERTEGAEEKVALIRRFAPKMRMDLTFVYSEDSADLVLASELLMGLDLDNNRVRIRIEFVIENAKGLLDDFEGRRRKDESLNEFLKDKYKTYFGRVFSKVSTDGVESEPLKDGSILNRLMKINVVSAQRHVDDDETYKSAKLSNLLHEHYTRFYRVDDAEGYYGIEDALAKSASELTEKYGGAFTRLTARLKAFGYPQGQVAPDLRIRAEMNSQTLYKDNTHIYYANEYADKEGAVEEFELPEKYNGLGYKNLIYIVLQLESFRATLEASSVDRPRVHIIGIEEPEAHLHPQMQCVFINEISKALELNAETTAQVVLSTHSSHIIANSGFEPVRYFRRSGREVRVRDLSKLPIPIGDPDLPDVLDFLRRYIKLTHCDLFFADKAILVEGQVERLLLPLMIDNCSPIKGCADLLGQYISISEIGGAHADKFKPLLDFLGIPTLIVTDLDSVDDAGKKCPVAVGKRTSNVCLKTWLPAKGTITELMNSDETTKIENRIRVAYQTPEGGNCGRSFEEAFIYANLGWLTSNYTSLTATRDLLEGAITTDLTKGAWELSGKLSKVDFALDLIAKTGWKTPGYIQEGLVWLARERAV